MEALAGKEKRVYDYMLDILLKLKRSNRKNRARILASVPDKQMRAYIAGKYQEFRRKLKNNI